MSEKTERKTRNRKKVITETLNVRLKGGTTARVDKVRAPGEGRSKLIRAAIEKEIERRLCKARDERRETESVPSDDDGIDAG